MVTISKELLKIINNYVLELSKEININKVILFGSYAKGTNHEDSDIDLAIFSDDFSNMDRIEALKFLLLKASDLTVDLQPQPFTLADLEDEDNWLAKEVEETGIELNVA
ncbi:MAG: nucleotidyltransferase domain-containing protein [Clostridia bacterium]|nr:nucleotidyltransferase domain-containing protein [Clostridia bacterium]